jgi:hypothetical protein
MMKKLLVLALVLGMASVSQGALSWLAIDSSTALPTVGTAGSIQIDIMTDFTCVGWQLGCVYASSDKITVSGAANSAQVTGGIVSDGGYKIGTVQGGKSLLFDVATGFSSAGQAAGDMGHFTVNLAAGWGAFTIDNLATGTAYLDGSSAACTAADTYAAPKVGPPASVGITGLSVVPEPMTMALLGLGGLFLRRRSK